MFGGGPEGGEGALGICISGVGAGTFVADRCLAHPATDSAITNPASSEENRIARGKFRDFTIRSASGPFSASVLV